jgi:hypothetical protein
MAARTRTTTIEHVSLDAQWHPAARAAFRFCFVYFALYALATQVAGGLVQFPGFSFPSLGTRWPLRDITLWLATHLFHLTEPLIYSGNSGDTAFHWIQTGWLLVVAIVVSTIWALIDRDRPNYANLAKWSRLFVRFALAAQMFYFGMAKVIPTQFSAPSLVTLVQPVGQLSLTDMQWTTIGSSVGYQMFTGWAEVIAGALLIVPQTAMLGAAIALADMVQVFALNMTYDIGLKLISFHLIAFALVLLAPDLRRLARMFVLDRPVAESSHAPLFRTARANRRAVIAQIVFGIYLVSMFTRLAVVWWFAPGGGGSPKSALYGIWDVDRLSVDDDLRPPVLNDYNFRWRRVIFDAPERLVFQRTDDSFDHYGVTLDVGRHSIDLTKGNSKTWKANFTFNRPKPEQLFLDGEMDGHRIHLELELVPLDTFRLLGSSFRWIRPPDPYGG